MSRPLRIQFPGAWYHVMNRGLNRSDIFYNNIHRELFIKLLKDIYKQYGAQTHAYCLMDNHYHLILHTPEPNLSRAMRHLDGIYTQKFNRNMGRDGPLFRGRYKSILIEAENYLLELSRYIHLNPVAAKLCINPEEYAWSSYKFYLKQCTKPEWLFCDEILSHCSASGSIKEYKNFMEAGLDEDLLKIFNSKKLPSILGDESWIEQIKKQYIPDKIDEEVPESKVFLKHYQFQDIDILMKNVADYYGVSLNMLKQSGHGHSENIPRNMFIYLAAIYSGYKDKAIADYIGGLGRSAITKIKKRMNERLKSNKYLFVDLEKLKAENVLSHVPT